MQAIDKIEKQNKNLSQKHQSRQEQKELQESQRLDVGKLEKILLLTIKEEKGELNERVWKVACALSFQYFNQAMASMQEKQIAECEGELIMALQYTEPDFESGKIFRGWEQFPTWHFQRINICIQLAIIYKKRGEILRAYKLIEKILKRSSDSGMWDTVLNHPESKIEAAFLQMSEMAIESGNMEMGGVWAQRVIESIDKQVESEIYKENFSGNHVFLQKKGLIRAHAYFLLGKCAKREEKLKYFREAYKISFQSAGQEDPRTQKYRKKYIEQKKETNFIENSLDSLGRFVDEVKKIKDQEKTDSHLSISESDGNDHYRLKKEELINVEDQKQIMVDVDKEILEDSLIIKQNQAAIQKQKQQIHQQSFRIKLIHDASSVSDSKKNKTQAIKRPASSVTLQQSTKVRFQDSFQKPIISGHIRQSSAIQIGANKNPLFFQEQDQLKSNLSKHFQQQYMQSVQQAAEQNESTAINRRTMISMNHHNLRIQSANNYYQEDKNIQVQNKDQLGQLQYWKNLQLSQSNFPFLQLNANSNKNSTSVRSNQQIRLITGQQQSVKNMGPKILTLICQQEPEVQNFFPNEQNLQSLREASKQIRQQQLQQQQTKIGKQSEEVMQSQRFGKEIYQLLDQSSFAENQNESFFNKGLNTGKKTKSKQIDLLDEEEEEDPLQAIKKQQFESLILSRPQTAKFSTEKKNLFKKPRKAHDKYSENDYAVSRPSSSASQKKQFQITRTNKITTSEDKQNQQLGQDRLKIIGKDNLKELAPVQIQQESQHLINIDPRTHSKFIIQQNEEYQPVITVNEAPEEQKQIKVVQDHTSSSSDSSSNKKNNFQQDKNYNTGSKRKEVSPLITNDLKTRLSKLPYNNSQEIPMRRDSRQSQKKQPDVSPYLERRKRRISGSVRSNSILSVSSTKQKSNQPTGNQMLNPDTAFKNLHSLSDRRGSFQPSIASSVSISVASKRRQSEFSSLSPRRGSKASIKPESRKSIFSNRLDINKNLQVQRGSLHAPTGSERCINLFDIEKEKGKNQKKLKTEASFKSGQQGGPDNSESDNSERGSESNSIGSFVKQNRNMQASSIQLYWRRKHYGLKRNIRKMQNKDYSKKTDGSKNRKGTQESNTSGKKSIAKDGSQQKFNQNQQQTDSLVDLQNQQGKGINPQTNVTQFSLTSSIIIHNKLL